MSDLEGDGREQEARAEQLGLFEPVAPVEAIETIGRPRRHRLAIAAILAGLVGGLAVGLTLGGTGVAHSQSSSTTSPPSSTSTDTGARDQYLQSVLAPLVKNGTITQAQADAVVKQLESAAKARIGSFPKMRGFGDVFSAAAKTIGVTEDELRTALRNGQSIADVAKSKHVDPNAVVDAMVAATKSHLDQAVKDGKISASVEQTQLNNLKTIYTTIVNGKVPQGFGFGFGFGFHFGHRFEDHGDNQNGNQSGTNPNSAPDNAGFSGAPFATSTI